MSGGKALEVFDLCGSLPPLPSSPHVVLGDCVHSRKPGSDTAAGKGRGTLELEQVPGRPRACC